MKRYTLLLICALVLASFGAKANTEADRWFERANAFYNEGNYDSAMMLYEQILATEVESAPLYFNMGNTYYKMREYPMSIYCYEKALKLDPGNDDVRNNLAIANLAIVDKVEPLPQSFIVRGWNGMKSWLSSDQWAYVSIIAFALLLVAAYLFLRARRMGWRKLGFFGGVVMVVVIVLSVVFAAQLKHDSITQDQAIVMSPTVTVKSSPNATSINLFVLHEGTKVNILDEADGWCKIKIANGSVGWLQADFMRTF